MYREGESESASERETETGTEKDRERERRREGGRESITQASSRCSSSTWRRYAPKSPISGIKEHYITHKRALQHPAKSPVLSPKRELLTLLLRAVTRRARARAHGLAPPPRVGGEGEGSNAADTVRNTSEVMCDEPAAKSRVEREREREKTRIDLRVRLEG